MARTQGVLGTGARLSDSLSASLLARVYPAAMIGEILNEHGCNSQRIRSRPAVAGTYFWHGTEPVPGSGLRTSLRGGLARRILDAGYGYFSHHRQILPQRNARQDWLSGPLQTLVARACIPLADATHHPDAFDAGLRLVALDGSNLEVADEPDNIKAFGYPGSRTGHAGYPHAQCAVLVECASHAILAANLGAYRESEWAVCTPLLTSLDDSMLCLADRGLNGDTHWGGGTRDRRAPVMALREPSHAPGSQGAS